MVCQEVLHGHILGHIREVHDSSLLPLELIDCLRLHQCGTCKKWFLKLAKHKLKCPNRDVKSRSDGWDFPETSDDVPPLTWNANPAPGASTASASVIGSNNLGILDGDFEGNHLMSGMVFYPGRTFQLSSCWTHLSQGLCKECFSP